MNTIAAIFETPLALGSTVSIPVVLFIICLLVKVRPMTALKTSFSVGFCMVGMTVLIGRFGQLLTDLAAILVEHNGFVVQVADAGRRVALTITSASDISIYIMPLALFINLVMLLTRSTRTINIDLWSFWLFAFTGAMVQSLTGNMAYGIVAAGVTVVFTLVVADSSVKGVEKCCAMHGVSFTNAVTSAYAPIAGGVCFAIDHIPLKGRKDISFGWLQKRVGYFGDPVLIGTVGVAALGLFNGMGVVQALQTAVQVGAYIFIVPKIMLLMGDSLKPLALGLDSVSREKFKLHGNLTIGLSSVNGLGNPTAMLLSVIMVPVTIWIASWLPNNRFIPSLDFYMLPYMLIIVVAICRGGILRSSISCVISAVVMIYSSSALSGLFTQAAIAADPAVYGAAEVGLISNMYGAGSPVVWLLSWVSTFGIAGMGLMIVIVLGLSIWNFNRLTGNVKIYVKKQKAMRTFAIDSIREEAERRKELKQNAVSKKREELRKAVETDRMIRGEGLETAPDEPEQLTIFATPTPQEIVDETVSTNVKLVPKATDGSVVQNEPEPKENP